MSFSVAIMAGGKSSRMGTDKSFVALLGRPMIEQVIERVAGLGAAETLLITNRPADYAQLGLPMYSDVWPEKGPLGGIYTALHYSQMPHTLVVACDMPFLNPSLLGYMLGLIDSEIDLIAPRVEGYPEALHAIYSRACLAPIQKRIEQDLLKVISFYGLVRVRYVDEAEYQPLDPHSLSFYNVNTPEELAAAQALADQK